MRGQCLAPLRMPVTNPLRRPAQLGIVRLEQRQHIRRRQSPTLHLVQRGQRHAQRPRPLGQAREWHRIRLANLDQRIGDRMLERTIHRLVGKREQRGDRARRTDPAERLGGCAAHRRRGGSQESNQAVNRTSIPVQPGRVRRRLLNIRSHIGQGSPSRTARAVALDTAKRPDCVLPSRHAPPSQPLDQGRNGSLAALGQGDDRAAVHHRTHVVEPRDEPLNGGVRPVQPLTARVGWRLGSRFLYSVDRAQDFRPPELRCRATQLVPAAGVEHEEAAVGVLQHVGGVKVGVGRGQKIGVNRAERRAFQDEFVPLHTVQVELTGKQVAGEAVAEYGRLVKLQPTRRGRAEVGQHRHQFAGARMVVQHTVPLAVDAAVYGVDQAVAPAAGGVLQKRRREDAFAGGGEHDIHRVVHPAGHHRLVRAARRMAAKNMRRTRHPLGAPERRIPLLRECALAPVNPSVTAEVRPVQVVGTAGERGLEPLLTLVGHAVAVGIAQPPDARRCGDVERAVMPQRPLGKHHLVSEHDGVLEPTVAVAIL